MTETVNWPVVLQLEEAMAKAAAHACEGIADVRVGDLAIAQVLLLARTHHAAGQTTDTGRVAREVRQLVATVMGEWAAGNVPIEVGPEHGPS